MAAGEPGLPRAFRWRDGRRARLYFERQFRGRDRRRRWWLFSLETAEGPARGAGI